MSRPTVRSHSPAVYRRRRLAVVVIALLVIGAGVALAIWQPWRAIVQALADGSAPASSSAPAPAAPPPASESGSPDPSASSEPTEPATSASDDPSPDPSATIAVCSSGAVTVTAVLDQQSYGSGENPKLSISLVNDGDEACVMNVGTATQTFTIESGPDVWWRSTDCQGKSSDQVVQLEPGQSVSSVKPLTWDRTRSSVDTCDRDRAAARPGYYNLTVSIGGIDSEPRQFRLR